MVRALARIGLGLLLCVALVTMALSLREGDWGGILIGIGFIAVLAALFDLLRVGASRRGSYGVTRAPNRGIVQLLFLCTAGALGWAGIRELQAEQWLPASVKLLFAAVLLISAFAERHGTLHDESDMNRLVRIASSPGRPPHAAIRQYRDLTKVYEAIEEVLRRDWPAFLDPRTSRPVAKHSVYVLDLSTLARVEDRTALAEYLHDVDSELGAKGSSMERYLPLADRILAAIAGIEGNETKSGAA